MPIYEYQCQKCGKDFELFRGVREAVDPVCKFCGGPVRKRISLSSFHLKGSGWYVTDYGRKDRAFDSGKKEEKSESAGKSEKSESSTTTPKESTTKE
jgi:putative FmdB family regulatory protein